MNNTVKTSRLFAVVITLLLLYSAAVWAQNRPEWKPSPGDTLTSYRVLGDLRVYFAIYAPKATEVLLAGSDLPGLDRGAKMNKRDDGVWEITVGPVPPGAYRYHFNVDGLAVIDPRNPLTSQSNMNTWSLFYTGGSEWMDARDVPRGAIAEVTYFSKSLNRFRRMHIYTPPGYESGKGKYPVFYLLHGAWDCDDSWTTVGRAGFIIDNLLAAKKAKPMIIVMPAGHTGPFLFSSGTDATRPQVDEFSEDFVKDVMPHVDAHYRVLKGRNHRAMAGLSMGGGQTLNIGLMHLNEFAYLGVFSSGIFGINGKGGPAWEEKNKLYLTDARAKQGLKLLWLATGKDDFLVETSRATVEFLKKYEFNPIYKETEGAHTWLKWRDYLYEFAPMLF